VRAGSEEKYQNTIGLELKRVQNLNIGVRAICARTERTKCLGRCLKSGCGRRGKKGKNRIFVGGKEIPLDKIGRPKKGGKELAIVPRERFQNVSEGNDQMFG